MRRPMFHAIWLAFLCITACEKTTQVPKPYIGMEVRGMEVRQESRAASAGVTNGNEGVPT